MAANRALLLLFLSGCAVPVPPSGGPPDEVPPVVIRTEPADGTVQVSPTRVRIEFNEFIDGRSAAAAVSVTPEPNRPVEVRPGGKSIDVLFQEPLRPNTTYIVTVDTGLRDAHNVALAAPIRVAFATGPRINQGRLAGTVLRAEDGNPEAGMDIYAYLSPAGLAPAELPDESRPPDYRTQTGTDGRFAFGNLEESSYFVVGVRDANRNRSADPGERLAFPPRATFLADTDSLGLGTWLSAMVDTTAPALRRVQPLSQRRLELLFDSDVRLLSLDPALWELRDTLTQQQRTPSDVYQLTGTPRSVFLRTDPLSGTTWSVYAEGGAIADSTGNTGRVGPAGFAPSLRQDTLRTRFLGFEIDTLAVDGAVRVLQPGTAPRLLFSQPPAQAVLENAVVVTDQADEPVSWRPRSQNGTRIEIDVEGTEPRRLLVDLRAFAGPDSTAMLEFTHAGAGRLGEVAGMIRREAAAVRIRLLASGLPGHREVEADSTGRFVFVSLPGGAGTRLDFYEDLNGNGRWDFGRLAPFAPSERRGWLEAGPDVRARWETVVPDTLQLQEHLPSRPQAPADTTGGLP